MPLNILERTPLLTPQRLEVRTEGELVVMRIGGHDLKMHYEDALKVSQWIRLRAKQAKRQAGDQSRHWSVVGDLSTVRTG